MKTSARIRPLLAVLLALVAGGMLTNCKSIPFMGGGFELEIQPMAGQPSQLQELYIIVSPQRNVQDALRSEKYGELLNEKKINNDYASFRQYRPTESGSWAEEFKANDSSMVTYKVKDSKIIVKVDKKIAGSQGIEHSLIILGFFGSAGFPHATLTQPLLDSGEDQRVEIGAAQLSLTKA